MHVRRVLVGLTPAQEAKPVLDPKRIRHGTDEDPSGLEDAACLGDERLRKAHVLEQFPGDDRVELLAVERERRLDVGGDHGDAELLRLCERALVDVDSDDLVPLEEVAGESAGAAAEVEHAPALPIASWKSGIRSGTKTNSPEFRRSRW